MVSLLTVTMGTLEVDVSVMLAVGDGVSVNTIWVFAGGAGVSEAMLGCGDGWMFTGGWISHAACAVIVATKSGPAVGVIPPGMVHARMVIKAMIENRYLFDFDMFAPGLYPACKLWIARHGAMIRIYPIKCYFSIAFDLHHSDDGIFFLIIA